MASSKRRLICAAIDKRQVVIFTYKNRRRVAEPHAFGPFENGQYVLHAWQRSGGSGMDWRDFHVDEISDFALTDVSFRRPHSGYNPAGKPFAHIICCVPPGRARETTHASCTRPKGGMS
jgi:predicted DNA-binding transcriptional regulator YafY